MAFSFERDIMPRCLRRTTTTILLLLLFGGGDDSTAVVVVVVDVMNGDDGGGGVETLCGRSSGTIPPLLLFAGAEKPSGSPQDALYPPVVMACLSRGVDSTLLSDQTVLIEPSTWHSHQFWWYFIGHSPLAGHGFDENTSIGRLAFLKPRENNNDRVSFFWIDVKVAIGNWHWHG
jgi:hypothetical protein